MKFDRQQFNWDCMYLTYGPNRTFVARFKNGGMSHFRSFLIKNFSVEEYFAQREANVAPLTILETKGYICQNVAKALKFAGYPATLEGKQQYLNYQMAKLKAINIATGV